MKKKIAFHSNQLSLTGTEVALYDYAKNNEDLLGNDSFIVYDKNNISNNPLTIDKFKDRFDLHPYSDKSDIDKILSKSNADLLYAIKSGRKDGLLSKIIPTMIHAVFPTSPNQIHGASCAFISDWLSLSCSNNKVPCVPHIVDLPFEDGNLRKSLKIPASAIVFGCYGGTHNFDVPCAIQAVRFLLREYSNIFFLFMNIKKFVVSPNAIFLPGQIDLNYKSKFINTCDAMLHARLQGESFGLACGEFSIKNKPILTFLHSKHKQHHIILGEKGLYYKNTDELISIIKNFQPITIKNSEWDRYSENFNKFVVMAKFDEHLIQKALRNKGLRVPEIKFEFNDHLSYMKLKIQMRLSRFI